MIDYILAFPDETTARTDAIVGAYWIPPSDDGPGQWRGDVCIPGLAVTIAATGVPLDALWRIAIGLPARNAVLEASPALEIVADRDLANAGVPLADYVLHSSVPLANLAALLVSPQFAGANYVYGAQP
jgi:hypothetical protein